LGAREQSLAPFFAALSLGSPAHPQSLGILFRLDPHVFMAQQERREPDRRLEISLRARVDQGIDQLLGELKQGKSERLEQYLAFTARFHRYSLNNQMLIYLQCPHATYVAGYKGWQELGYQVAGGEKGIRILAPRTHKRTNLETGEKEEVIHFVAVSVFDASQLANVKDKPLPAFFTPLADDQQGLYDRLGQAVTEDGITVNEEKLGREQGYSRGGRIGIREGLDSRNKVLTLLHEYAHELLHWRTQERERPLAVKECHAEAVAYVVVHHFGLHNPFSADYLQHWGTTPKDLLAELDVVRRTSAYIIDRVESRNAPSDQAKPSLLE
jgi:N-terminal domain of anti-restriction factor ArdC